MTTRPILPADTYNRLKHLCNCGRSYAANSGDHIVSMGGKYGLPTCPYYTAAHLEWEEWYRAKDQWETRAKSAIKAGRFSQEALDFIAYYRSSGEGDISRQVNYLLELIQRRS